MEVEILTTEFIKPSSPTPAHLKLHNLSCLDQSLHPHFHNPIYLFYQISNSPQECCNRLKTSLSRLLTFYYPFAGTIHNHCSILCDDHGVPFTHGKVNFPISDFFQSPDLIKRLPEFLPESPSAVEDLVMVQVTDFSCGGFLIAVVLSHAVADGATICAFLNGWATLCRAASGFTTAQVLPPNFAASIHFPPAERVPDEAKMVPHVPQFVKKGKLRVRRLVFDPTAIRVLKENATSASVPNPSRVEVVSGHLVKCIMSAVEATSGSRKVAMVSLTVNLRRREEPVRHGGGSMIGNYLWPVAVLRSGEQRNELLDFVSQLRRATSEIDGDLVARLRSMGSEKVFEELAKVHCCAPPGTELVQIGSCCNLGIYETDFGWGKPIWACFIGAPAGDVTEFINLIMLSDTRSGDGVEALVFLEERDFAFLERNQELLAYAVFDPNPLLMGPDPPFS